MKYRISYDSPFEYFVGMIDDDYAFGTVDLKHIIKNAKRPIRCITKIYVDGAGVNVTDKYVKQERRK